MSTRADRGLIPKPGRFKGPLAGRKYGSGAPPAQTRPVKGVGRFGTRGYCERCGHTRGRCICPQDAA
jgi:hypothetical protein